MAFYTSRVVLQQLGDDNFPGIYQTVAGTITMFAVLRGAFDSATQRYYNYALAKGNNNYLSQNFFGMYSDTRCPCISADTSDSLFPDIGL